MKILLTTKPFPAIHLGTGAPRIFQSGQEICADWPVRVVEGVAVFEQDNEEFAAPEEVLRGSTVPRAR